MRLRRLLLLTLALLVLSPPPANAQGVERSVRTALHREIVRLRDQQREPNVNAKYIIEDVEVRGVRLRDLTGALQDDLRALIGRRLDSEEVDQFETRLRQAFPDHLLRRRTARGSEPGRIRLVFDATRVELSRWLRFEPQEVNLIYHSDQGWGSRLPLSFSTGTVLVSPVFAIDIGDELVEEYSGVGIRVETRQLGTERLGAFFEWSSFDQTWRQPTLDVLAGAPLIPAAYRTRRSLTSLLKVAGTRQLTLAGGVRITELDAMSETDESRMANAAIGSLTFTQQSRRTDDEPRHFVNAGFIVRAGTAALESDLIYERYVGHVGYAYRRARHTVSVSGMVGRLEGDAPLFERFTLGDSRTLRGWDKYDIAPAGGERAFHGSLEYRYRGFGMFVDAGSVWDRGNERRVRVSTGLTFNRGPAFATLGFPVNTDDFRTVFTMGIRFSNVIVGRSNY